MALAASGVRYGSWIPQISDTLGANLRRSGSRVEEDDALAAFGAFELFAALAGRTCTRWTPEMVEAARPGLSDWALAHWLINIPRLNDRLKAMDKMAREVLAYAKDREQAPWV